jgi:hypothetical protein
MNERIQALAYEAEDYSDGIVDQGGEFHEAYTKKLAELIVRECADVCQGFGESGDGYTCSYEILEHFGVEE